MYSEREKIFLRAVRNHIDPRGWVDFVYWTEHEAKMEWGEANDLANILEDKGAVKFIKQDVQKMKGFVICIELTSVGKQWLREDEQEQELKRRSEEKLKESYEKGELADILPPPKPIKEKWFKRLFKR